MLDCYFNVNELWVFVVQMEWRMPNNNGQNYLAYDKIKA